MEATRAGAREAGEELASPETLRRETAGAEGQRILLVPKQQEDTSQCYQELKWEPEYSVRNSGKLGAQGLQRGRSVYLIVSVE